MVKQFNNMFDKIKKTKNHKIVKTIIKINFLILLSGITLHSVNAGLQEIRNEESKITTEISDLCANNLNPEKLEAIIEKIQTACNFVKKEIVSIKGLDRTNGSRALGRLKADLAFLKAIFEYIKNSCEENKALLDSFANSNYRYSVLLKKLNLVSN